MKAVVAAFNQEKALVGAFSVITNLRMDLRFKLYHWPWHSQLTAALSQFPDSGHYSTAPSSLPSHPFWWHSRIYQDTAGGHTSLIIMWLLNYFVPPMTATVKMVAALASLSLTIVVVLWWDANEPCIVDSLSAGWLPAIFDSIIGDVCGGGTDIWTADC